nr:hypothetical protein Iba_scaffold822539CG0010 [Ipomoea batatas]
MLRLWLSSAISGFRNCTEFFRSRDSDPPQLRMDENMVSESELEEPSLTMKLSAAAAASLAAEKLAAALSITPAKKELGAERFFKKSEESGRGFMGLNERAIQGYGIGSNPHRFLGTKPRNGM